MPRRPCRRLESVEQAVVRSTLGTVRDTESLDLNEALVGRVPEPLDHDSPTVRTLGTRNVGIDGVELGAAVSADNRLASIDESIVGAGVPLGALFVPSSSSCCRTSAWRSCPGRSSLVTRSPSRSTRGPLEVVDPEARLGVRAETSGELSVDLIHSYAPIGAAPLSTPALVASALLDPRARPSAGIERGPS